MKKIRVILLMIILMLGSKVYGQNKEVYGYPEPSIGFRVYEPKIVYSINEAPESVMIKVSKYLEDRVGKEFLSKLNFASVKIIDLRELYKVEPQIEQSSEWQKAPFSYEVSYKYSEPNKGLKEFYASVKLNENEEIVEDINLPEISKYSYKATIISIKRVFQLAKKKGVNKHNTLIEIKYSREADALVWVIQERLYTPDCCSSKSRVLEINAHNGTLLEDFMVQSIE